MDNNSLLSQVLKVVHKLSPGLLLVGICLMGWAAYQIYAQSVPAPAAIESTEQIEQAALATPADTATEQADENETEETIAYEQQTATASTVDTETKTAREIKTQLPVDKEASAVELERTLEKVATHKPAKAHTGTAKQTQTVMPAITSSSDEILYPVRPTKGENIGNLTLPAIDKVLPIVHGTDEDELNKGIGHFAGSVLPGENDNSVLSGHRDTVFRELGELEVADKLIVETSAGKFTYQIREIKIVPKDDKSIIIPTASAVLTVTTCYPFNFIGSAPDRYILVADLVSNE